MWAALTALFVVFIVGVVVSVIWLASNVISFLQPILIPVAIAAILAYLLDPVVNYLVRRLRIGRTKATLLLFAVVFSAIAGLLAWLVPVISFQSASVAKELPAYTQRARDTLVGETETCQQAVEGFASHQPVRREPRREHGDRIHGSPE